jgi:hypothetical protein
MYGIEDGKANKSFEEERSHGCQEFDVYRDGYQAGCEYHTTQASCELAIWGQYSRGEGVLVFHTKRHLS